MLFSTKNASRWCVIAALCSVGLSASCQQTQVVVPASLEGPRALVLARGRVCMDSLETSDGLYEPVMRACEAEERGSIGLVVNDTLSRVSVVDMGLTLPRLVDLDVSVPGITSIPVGKWPVDLSVNPQGDVAYVANQQDKSLSLINLWLMRALPDAVSLPGHPVKVAHSAKTGQVVAALNLPSALWLQQSAVCEPDALGQGDRRTADPSVGCALPTDAPATLSLDSVGTISDLKLSPDGQHAYVLYADNPVLSVVALALADAEVCLDGGAAPCEVARIGLTFGCSDGIDNDGDGLIDQADPQCYGPYGAESADGLGRAVQDVCADGLDNDGDGLTDRDDPQCAFASSTSEEVLPDGLGALACSDGQDNDGDGRFDYPEDLQCYGAHGQREAQDTRRGFNSMGIDELGAFLYVTDGPNQQVLVVDLAHRALIDAPRMGEPVEAFADTLGVRLGRTPAPISIVGRVSRAVTTLEDDPSQGVIRYDYGAYVAAENGFVYYIDAVRAYCQLDQAGEEILTTAQFYDDPEQRAKSKEAACLSLPALPLPAPSATVESCEQVFLCQACVDQGGSLESCAPCEQLEGELATQLSACQLTERRLFEQDGVKLAVNPRFTLRDRYSERGGEVGRAVCTISDAQVELMEQYVEQNNARSVMGCGSPLLPQPLSVTVPTEGAQALSDYLSEPRLDFVEQRTLTLVTDQEDPIVEVSRADERLLAEEISVTYEGVLPSTKRTDGLAQAQGDAARFDVGALDVCRAGVQVGDLLIIKSAPGSENGGLPEACQALSAPDGRSDDFLSYKITEIRDGELGIEVIGDVQGQPSYAQSLPTSECFPTGISYEVRAPEQWIVAGSTTGVAVGAERAGGVCVPTPAALSGRANARVRSGERFIGIYYSFYLYPGLVAPVRDLSYKMTLVRNFSPASLESGLVIRPELPSPTQIVFADRLPGGRYVFVVDPSDDIIYGHNVLSSEGFGLR